MYIYTAPSVGSVHPGTEGSRGNELRKGYVKKFEILVRVGEGVLNVYPSTGKDPKGIGSVW